MIQVKPHIFLIKIRIDSEKGDIDLKENVNDNDRLVKIFQAIIQRLKGEQN